MWRLAANDILLRVDAARFCGCGIYVMVMALAMILIVDSILYATRCRCSCCQPGAMQRNLITLVLPCRLTSIVGAIVCSLVYDARQIRWCRLLRRRRVRREQVDAEYDDDETACKCAEETAGRARNGLQGLWQVHGEAIEQSALLLLTLLEDGRTDGCSRRRA